MIIDRYERPKGVAAPKVSDPIWQEIDWILDDPSLPGLVRRDRQKHSSRSERGRHPVPVEGTLRMTVLRRRKKWPYRQAEQEVPDGPADRWWVRVYDQPVPDPTPLNDLERQIQPKTVHRRNDRGIARAQDYPLTRGDRLRVERRVTESNLHYPTASSWLADGVRLLSRLLESARPLLAARMSADAFSHPARRARRRARQISQLSRPLKAGREPGPTAGGNQRLEQGLFRTDRDRRLQCDPGSTSAGRSGTPGGRPRPTGASGVDALHSVGGAGD